jgi:hypothetical protein
LHEQILNLVTILLNKIRFCLKSLNVSVAVLDQIEATDSYSLWYKNNIPYLKELISKIPNVSEPAQEKRKRRESMLATVSGGIVRQRNILVVK